MRPSAPVAGSATKGFFPQILKGIFALIVAAAGVAAADSPPADPRPFLTPQESILGGFGAAPSPLPIRPPTGSYVKLLHPSAVTANGTDLYVADSGRRLLLRIDTVTKAVTPLREITAAPGIRLETDRDGSVYILQPNRANVERVSRDGRRISEFSSEFEILQPADIAVERTLGRLWMSDRAGGVFAFHPSGRMEHSLLERNDGFPDELAGATLLATHRFGIVGIDPRCRCLVAFGPDGAYSGHFGDGELIDPVDLATDSHGRVWVIDRGDRLLKIFAEGQRVGAIDAARLGLIEMTALAIDGFQAYISDARGGKIAIFAVVPPKP